MEKRGIYGKYGVYIRKDIIQTYLRRLSLSYKPDHSVSAQFTKDLHQLIMN